MNNVAIDRRTDLRHAVLKTIQYYSIFRYPVEAEEVHGSCSLSCSFTSVLHMLEELEQEKTVYCYKGYYSLSHQIKEEVARRIEGNTLAAAEEKNARRAGNFIYQFPFVKFVGISGSLSKGFAENTSDYDFFIVTDKNRLWICRTLLHVFKKITFVVGQQHKFCMNYFIDTHKLEIDEHNLFTAIELSSLVPVNGTPTYLQLMKSNEWIKSYLPNGYRRFVEIIPANDKNSLLKRAAEFVIQLFSPAGINKGLMKLTDTKWRRKWEAKNYPMQDYDLAFKTTIHISKNHPANHQKRVLKHLSDTAFRKNA